MSPSGYRTEDVSHAFRSRGATEHGHTYAARKRPRDGERRAEVGHDRDDRVKSKASARKKRGDVDPNHQADHSANAADHHGEDRERTTPFLIRVFPYLVPSEDVSSIKASSKELKDVFRPIDKYCWVYDATATREDGLEEICVHTWLDASLLDVIAQVEQEMKARGMKTAGAGAAYSLAAVWEEWHRQEHKYFMRCRSVGKVNMTTQGFTKRYTFPDAGKRTLRSLGWRVGDALEMCVLDGGGDGGGGSGGDGDGGHGGDGGGN